LTTDDQLAIADIDHLEEASHFETTRDRYDLFQTDNTAIPDKVFGPDEERIFIDDDPFELEEKLFSIEHANSTIRQTPTVTMLNLEAQPTQARHHHRNIGLHRDRNQRGTHDGEQIRSEFYEPNESDESKQESFPTTVPETTNKMIMEDFDSEDKNISITPPTYVVPSNSSHLLDFSSEEYDTTATERIMNGSLNETKNDEMTTTNIITTVSKLNNTEAPSIKENEERQEKPSESDIFHMGKKMEKTVGIFEIENKNVTPIVLGSEDKDHVPTIGSIAAFNKSTQYLKNMSYTIIIYKEFL
jgi:hypothetical protein